jgi:hypothetical protein
MVVGGQRLISSAVMKGKVGGYHRLLLECGGLPKKPGNKNNYQLLSA